MYRTELKHHFSILFEWARDNDLAASVVFKTTVNRAEPSAPVERYPQPLDVGRILSSCLTSEGFTQFHNVIHNSFPTIISHMYDFLPLKWLPADDTASKPGPSLVLSDQRADKQAYRGETPSSDTEAFTFETAAVFIRCKKPEEYFEQLSERPLQERSL